jgi:hypothetical protein
MVEIAQEYVPDLFGKFSKTKTASVIKKLRKEISVNSYVWNSYTSPSETPIPVLLQVFNSVINVHTKDMFNNEMDKSHMDEHDDNETEIATLRAELARVTAERDVLVWCSDTEREKLAWEMQGTEMPCTRCSMCCRKRTCLCCTMCDDCARIHRKPGDHVAHKDTICAMEPDGPPPPLELVMCMPDGTELPQSDWESSFAAIFSDGFWVKITRDNDTIIKFGECPYTIQDIVHSKTETPQTEILTNLSSLMRYGANVNEHKEIGNKVIYKFVIEELMKCRRDTKGYTTI